LLKIAVVFDQARGFRLAPAARFLLGDVSWLRQVDPTNETRFFASDFPRPRRPECADEPVCEGKGGTNPPPFANSAVNDRGLAALAGEPPELTRCDA
jgi:hypothetical protein